MYSQWKSFEDHSFPYLNGNSFAVQCKHIWNYDGYKINPTQKPENWAYIKTDFISNFFSQIKISEPLVIFTGNSDYTINENHLQYLNDDSKVLAWFGQNVTTKHPKLKSLPIGIAPAGYAHGDSSILNKIREQKNKKVNMFYSNFSIQNNRKEREYCLEQTNIPLTSDVNGGWNGFAGGYKLANTFEGYLTDISKSYFCISPKGNGVDCHRTWESLYLSTIPIVTRSEIVEDHKDMPIIILDDWSDFKKINFNEELYNKIWNNFDVCKLHMDNYLRRIMKDIR